MIPDTQYQVNDPAASRVLFLLEAHDSWPITVDAHTSTTGLEMTMPSFLSSFQDIRHERITTKERRKEIIARLDSLFSSSDCHVFVATSLRLSSFERF